MPWGTPSSRSLVALLALTSASCSLVLDSDRHRSDAQPVAATDFCAELSRIVCAGRRDCCTLPNEDFDACVTDRAIDCADSFGELAIDPRTGYDEATAGLALAEGRRLLASCDPALYAWGTALTGFRRAAAGTVPYGGSCEPGLFDAAALVSCADDGVCVRTDGIWVCVEPIPEGESCTFDAACMPGLRCSTLAQFVLEGACLPLKEEGQACGRHTECASNICEVMCREATVEEAYCTTEPF